MILPIISPEISSIINNYHAFERTSRPIPSKNVLALLQRELPIKQQEKILADIAHRANNWPEEYYKVKISIPSVC